MSEAQIALPAKPAGYRRLRLYSPVWRAKPGDKIHGHVIATQYTSDQKGREVQALMLSLAAPANVFLFDEEGRRETEMRPVERTTPESFAIVAVPLDVPELTKLVVFADQPKVAQTIELHCLEIDGERCYLCFIAERPALRKEIDPIEIRRRKMLSPQELAAEDADAA